MSRKERVRNRNGINSYACGFGRDNTGKKVKRMDRLMKPAEVAEILGMKDKDAVRRIMRQMVHMEKPLRVSEAALQGWINARTYRPVSEEKGQTAQAEGRMPRRRGGKIQGVSA